MGRMDGKVALVTGAARGQGRSHAHRLAEEGADIVALDLCEHIGSTLYPGSTEAELEETASLIEDLDRRIVARRADVRDSEQLQAVVDEGLSEFGHIDVVSANAGIHSLGEALEIPDQQWQDAIDINLTGVWRTVKAVAPSMIEHGTGGSIVITASTSAIKGFPAHAHYSAAKAGLVGLMRVLANELGPHGIRVNAIHPSAVDTHLIHNDALYQRFMPDVENPTREQFAAIFEPLHLLPVPWLDTIDISNAILWLASDEARYVTGVELPVDAGFLQKAA